MAAINLPDTWGLIEFSVKLALTPLRFFFFFFFPFSHLSVSSRRKNQRSAPDLCDKWEGLRREQGYQSGDGRERKWQGKWDDYRRPGRAKGDATSCKEKNKSHRVELPSQLTATITNDLAATKKDGRTGRETTGTVRWSDMFNSGTAKDELVSKRNRRPMAENVSHNVS